MEYGMTNYPHCVILERNVYVGGGTAENEIIHDSDDSIVMMYNIDSGTWHRLSRYRCRRFAMTVINNQLTL